MPHVQPHQRKRKRRRRSSRSGAAAGFVAKYKWRLSRLLNLTVNSTAFAVFVAFCFLLIFAIDFQVLLSPFATPDSLMFDSLGTSLAEMSSDRAELIKRDMGIGIYACAVLLLVFNVRALIQFLNEHRHFALLFVTVLCTVLVSDYPVDVINGTIQLFSGFTIAFVFVFKVLRQHDPYKLFYLVVLIAMGSVQLVSVYLFFYHQFDLVSHLQSDIRYGGLSGNPNAAGPQGALGLWAGLSLLLTTKLSFIGLVMVLLFMAASVFTVAVSGSATSLVVTLVILFALLFFRVYSALPKKGRLPYLLVGILLTACSTIFLVVQTNFNQLPSIVTEELGKDATFTGRTELWAVAWEAIRERPLLGWSLDEHQTVKNIPGYDMVHNHYHNGFLDNLIVGGFLLLFLLLYNLQRFSLFAVRLMHMDKSAFPLMVPLVATIIMNLTEYSMFRPLNIAYQVYLMAFILVAIQSMRIKTRLS